MALSGARSSRAGRLAVAIAAIVVSAATGVPATAQENKDPVALFNEAVELAKNGQLSDAVAIWLVVKDDIPERYRPVVLSNLGLAYKKLKKNPEAWYYLDRYLSGLAEPEKAAVKARDEVEKEMKRTHVKVQISCDPADSHIYLGAEEAGTAYRCPLVWWFEPGKRPVRVSRAGYKASVDVLNVEKGKPVDVAFNLAPLPPEDGVLEIQGDAKAVQVFINGRLEGRVPFVRKLAPGTYDVMVGPPGKVPWKKKVTIEAGKTALEKPEVAQKSAPPPEEPKSFVPTVVTKPVKPESDVEGPSVLDWALIGGGAALVAAGGALHYMAYSRNGELMDKYPDGTAENPAPASNKSDYDQAFDDEVAPKMTAAWALYSVGLAAAATGTVLLVMDLQTEGSAGDVRIMPMPMPDGAGVELGLEF